MYLTCIGQKARDAKKANQSLFSFHKGRKVNDTELILSIVTTLNYKDRKVDNTKFCSKSATNIFCTSQTVKLFTKAKYIKKIHQTLGKTCF